MKKYNKEGQEITLLQWVDLQNDDKYISVDKTKILVPDEPSWEIVVSTVWIGISLGVRDGKPLIFETQIFDSHESRDERSVTTTLDEAKKVHRDVVNQVIGDIPGGKIAKT